MPKSKKPGTSREVVFVAPFSLKTCRLRLKNKASRKRFLSMNRDAEVYINRMNPDTLTFLVSRGALTVRGRLDMVSEIATQVSFQSSINWLAISWLTPMAVIAILAGVLIVGVWPLFFFGSFLASIDPAWEPVLAVPFLLGAGLVGISVWVSLAGRNRLAREIEMLLTDPIPDVPDLSALDSEADGELVAGPPLPSDGAQDNAHPLESLLAPKRRD